ncbi:MAG: DMT family transporter [Blautia sp.]
MEENNHSTKKQKLSGGWLVFLGAVFWSLNAPLVKFIHMDPMLICGLRSLIAGIALLPFIRIKKLNFNPWMLLYIFSYICLCMGIILSLSYTSAAIAIGMQYGAMVWIFIGSAILTKKFSFKKLLPVALIFSGVICFMLSGIKDGNIFGNLIALTESISFALMTISSQKCSGKNPLGLTCIANLCAGLFIFLFLSPSFSDLIHLSDQEWSIMLILGIVQVAMGYGFFNMGVQRTTAQKASIISLWEMILGPLWVALFLGEYPSFLVLAGFMIIVIGMIINALSQNNL